MMSRQGKHASIQQYYKDFQTQVKVLEQATGGHTTGKKLVNVELEKTPTITINNPLTNEQIADTNERASEAYLAIFSSWVPT